MNLVGSASEVSHDNQASGWSRPAAHDASVAVLP